MLHPSALVPSFILLILFLWSTAGVVVVTTITYHLGTDGGGFDYYYDDEAVCETVLFLAVGTAMSTTDYSHLSLDVVEHHPSMVVVIVDPAPGNMKKQDPKRFAETVNRIVSSSALDCDNPAYLVGGHSGGGEGAMRALPLLAFEAIGFVGLDPFQIPDNLTIDIPALFWGFLSTSCGVPASGAARRGYQQSNASHRVFYQVQTNNWNALGGPHCVFTDHGCADMCNPPDQQWVKEAVATTIHVFVQRLETFSRNAFQDACPPDTKLFFNEDSVRDDVTSQNRLMLR
jgi:hypothetical protein